MPCTLESATRGPLLPLKWVPYSFFAVGMVAAGAGGKRRSKFGTTSALLSMSRQTPSIAPTTVAVAKAYVESNFGRPTPSLSPLLVDFHTGDASAAWWMM